MTLKMELPWENTKPLFRYANETIRLKCFPEMLEWKLFPNFKEVTESFGAFNAIRASRGMLKREFHLDDPKIHCLVVADGGTPRTGATFAMRTAWKVWSVDPQLKNESVWESRVQRLTVVKDKIENFTLPECDTALVVAVHSHAILDFAMNACYRAKHIGVVAIPCCVSQKITDTVTSPDTSEVKPCAEYEDHAIWSPQNKVKTWYF